MQCNRNKIGNQYSIFSDFFSKLFQIFFRFFSDFLQNFFSEFFQNFFRFFQNFFRILDMNAEKPQQESNSQELLFPSSRSKSVRKFKYIIPCTQTTLLCLWNELILHLRCCCPFNAAAAATACFWPFGLGAGVSDVLLLACRCLTRFYNCFRNAAF